MTSDNVRSEKVAVVAEVKQKLSETEAIMLTEYRGLDVRALAQLRGALREAGGEYKIYKNTMVRLAAAELGFDLDELLTGPTALAFVAERADGSQGDAASLAKALSDFAKDNEALVIKGGVLAANTMSAAEVKALADLPSRDQMFAELAGAMESFFQDFAGLLDAKLRELAYGMEELLEKGGPGGASSTGAAPDATPDEAAAETDDATPDTDEAAPDTDDAAPETDEAAAEADDADADTEERQSEETGDDD